MTRRPGGGDGAAPPADRPFDDRTLRRQVGRLTALGVIALVVVVHGTVGLPLLPLEAPTSRLVGSLFRQRWVFFSADPGFERLTAVRRVEGAWRPLRVASADSLARSAGFGRMERTLVDELGVLLDAGEEAGAHARPCIGDVGRCADRHQRTSIRSPVPVPRVCGDVAIRRGRPAPWRGDEPPGRVVRLDVGCPSG